MLRALRTACGSAAIAAAFFAVAGAAQAVQVKVTITNNSSTGGVTLTPLWSALHAGTFDTFSPGAAASAGLESLAEEGDPSGIDAELKAADPGASTGVVIAPQGFAGAPLIEPGETASVRLDVDPIQNRYFSYLSMILPSNDQFIGNGDPMAYEIFDAMGSYLGEQVINVSGLNAWDAGTEVNDGLGSPFAQAGPGASSDEGGVVTQAPGIDIFAGAMLPNGQTLDLGAIGFAGNPDLSLATIRVQAVPIPASLPLIAVAFAILGVSARRRNGV